MDIQTVRKMISGSGLELSGGKFSLKDLAKGVGKAANVAIPLAQAFGVEGADQAAAVNNAIQGQGFGKGTQRKMLAAAKKGAKVADKLIDEFGDDEPKAEEEHRQEGRKYRLGLGLGRPFTCQKDEQTAGAGGGATEDGEPGSRPFVG